ncbi:hypothetical protein niasHT_008031 [Heterodera trifolii]|uniref:Peptidase M14 domain-containing protein n=1 Tax=Heterodera trifolii TaxID=157864 RepID=A0ABD2LZV7_9BILA
MIEGGAFTHSFSVRLITIQIWLKWANFWGKEKTRGNEPIKIKQIDTIQHTFPPFVNFQFFPFLSVPCRNGQRVTICRFSVGHYSQMGPFGRAISPQRLFFPLCFTFAYFCHTFSMRSVKYNGYNLYRIHLPPYSDTTNFVQWLEEMEAKLNELSHNYPPMLDIWALPNPLRRSADILLAPTIENAFISALRRGTQNEKDIDSEKNEIIRRKRLRRRKRRRRKRTEGEEGKEGKKEAGEEEEKEQSVIDLHTYNSYARMEQYMKRVAAEHPKVVELLNLTKTFEGRDLLGVRIGHRDGTVTKEAENRRHLVYIDAGVHAREWIAPAAALYLIHTLISLWDKLLLRLPPSHANASLSVNASVLRQFDFVVIPCANPDGYAFSMSRDRLWRKTRSRNDSLHKWCVGADANRNWGYRWAETGASRSPCSNIYPGRAPFSEPEVRAVRDLLSPELSRLVAYISLHSYGQLVLSPWGFSNAKPSNHWEQQKLASLVIDSIREATGTEYTFGTIADLLYPASGTSIDYWQYRGVPYIYGVELRPEDVESEIHGFAIPPGQIEPSGKEVFTMVKKMMEYVSENDNKRTEKRRT